jgi:hypothetical protein
MIRACLQGASRPFDELEEPVRKRSPLVVAVVAALLVLIIPASLLAALPAKGSLLKGKLHAAGITAVTKPIELKVASTGKTARFTWWCGAQKTVSNRYAISVAVKPDGTFKGNSNVGSLTVWTVSGRFLSPKTARASLRLIAICDGKGGLVNLAA